MTLTPVAPSPATAALSMAEREDILRRISMDLIRAADLAGGSEIATKQALWKIEDAIAQLGRVRIALRGRLAQLWGPHDPGI